MSVKDPSVQPSEGPQAQLVRAFIDEYVRLHGHDPDAIPLLPQAEVMTLLEAASVYAAGKLAEFESGAHDVHDIHCKD